MEAVQDHIYRMMELILEYVPFSFFSNMCYCLSKLESSDNYVLVNKIFVVYKEKSKVYKCSSKLKLMSSSL